MGNFLKNFVLRLTLSLAGKLFLGSMVGALLLRWAANSWSFLTSSPSLMGLASLIVLLLAVAAVIVYLRGNHHPTTYSPRYLLWYKFPIRQISWDLFGLLGMTGALNVPSATRIISFQPALIVNRGKIIPKAAYIQCKKTGARVDLTFAISPSHSVPASAVDHIPKGARVNCHGFVGHLTRDEFLRTYDGAELVFEYEGGKFTTRFSRKALRDRIDAFSNPPNSLMEPKIQLK